jgi:hypothetical protein
MQIILFKSSIQKSIRLIRIVTLVKICNMFDKYNSLFINSINIVNFSGCFNLK